MSQFIHEKLLIGNLLLEDDECELENLENQENLPEVPNKNTQQSVFSSKYPHPADFLRDQEQYITSICPNLARKASDFIPHGSQFVEMALDQQGSRYLQEKCESGCRFEKTEIIKQSVKHAEVLMEDIFGNYVIQKVMEQGGTPTRESLLLKIKGKMMRLSLNNFGCRVIQKLLDYPKTSGLFPLLLELDCARCIEDANGNHVIQKCLKSLPESSIGFIIQAISSNVLYWASHCYGCRVVQELISKHKVPAIKDELLASAPTLCKSEFGNYVIQKLVERYPRNTIHALLGEIEAFSKDKYASNVVEKCLVHGNHSQIQRIIAEVFGSPRILKLMTDKFANFVVQRIIEVASEHELDVVVGKIRYHEQVLKKSTLGKYVLKTLDKKLKS